MELIYEKMFCTFHARKVYIINHDIYLFNNERANESRCREITLEHQVAKQVELDRKRWLVRYLLLGSVVIVTWT